MRGDPPRWPARPSSSTAASAGSAEEVRPLPGDPSARRRDEASGRRQASASRLMGAVTRHLLDETEEDRVTGESSRDMGSGAAPTASATGSESAGKSAGKTQTRVSVGGKGKTPPRGTPDPVTRRGAASARRSGPPEDDVWAQGVDAADGAGRIVGPESRVQPRRSAARIEGVRPDAAQRVGRSPRMRIASWGAVLAAVAALVVMIAAGWLDIAPSDSANRTGAEAGAQRESASGR